MLRLCSVAFEIVVLAEIAAAASAIVEAASTIVAVAAETKFQGLD